MKSQLPYDTFISERTTSLAFSPDGKRLAVSGANGTVHGYALDIEELMVLAEQRLGAR